MWRSVVLAILVASACAPTGVTASPTPAPAPLSVVELKLRLFSLVGRPWYCDSDFYPIARADEKTLARQRLPEMQQDAEVWNAIIQRNNLPPTPASWSDAQLLAVYQDWKDLRALELTPVSPGVYGATYSSKPLDGTTQLSDRVELRIDDRGRVTIVSRQVGQRLNCPICLVDTTTIDTPSGPVRVTDLRVGDLVWTKGLDGQRVAAPLLAIGSMDAPTGHEVLRVTLDDGRAVSASPGHPTADGRLLGTLRVGDRVDGARISAIARLPYRGRTYDVLPAGRGVYWADGVLLRSTLHD